MALYPDFVQTCGFGSVTGIGGANCRHSYWPFIEGVMERTYTDQELENIDPPPFAFEGRTYTMYEATQKQRMIERTIRKLKREGAAFKAAGLQEEAQAVSIRIRRLDEEYRAFSKAAGLPQQRERMNALYTGTLMDSKGFAPLKNYAADIKIKGRFSEKEYEVEVVPPKISGTTKHFEENLRNRADRAGLNLEKSQAIIDHNKLVIYQPEKVTLKFLADDGYAVLSLSNELVTAVPEKLRSKYKRYLEGKNHGKTRE